MRPHELLNAVIALPQDHLEVFRDVIGFRLDRLLNEIQPPEDRGLIRDTEAVLAAFADAGMNVRTPMKSPKPNSISHKLRIIMGDLFETYPHGIVFKNHLDQISEKIGVEPNRLFEIALRIGGIKRQFGIWKKIGDLTKR